MTSFIEASICFDCFVYRVLFLFTALLSSPGIWASTRPVKFLIESIEFFRRHVRAIGLSIQHHFRAKATAVKIVERRMLAYSHSETITLHASQRRMERTAFTFEDLLGEKRFSSDSSKRTASEDQCSRQATAVHRRRTTIKSCLSPYSLRLLECPRWMHKATGARSNQWQMMLGWLINAGVFRINWFFRQRAVLVMASQLSLRFPGLAF